MNLKIENARKEYYEAIQKISEKYQLPIIITEMIIGFIYSEIVMLKNQTIQKESEENGIHKNNLD